MTYVLVDIHHKTHTCPADREPHPFVTTAPSSATSPAAPAVQPITVRCADTNRHDRVWPPHCPPIVSARPAGSPSPNGGSPLNSWATTARSTRAPTGTLPDGFDAGPRTLGALCPGCGLEHRNPVDATPADFTATGQAFTRAGQPDYFDWLDHIRAAAGCTRPIRLVRHPRTPSNRRPAASSTSGTPTPCPTGRSTRPAATAAPPSARPAPAPTSATPTSSCAPASSAAKASRRPSPAPGRVRHLHRPLLRHRPHPRRHAPHLRATGKRCDCRPEPCHARRDTGLCPHGRPAVCWARHDADDPLLGQPLCLDCYDHDHQVVWNLFAGELWHRTKQAAERHLAQLARRRGIPRVPVVTDSGKIRHVPPVRLSHGKAAEMQRRGAVHFHALVRLDGVNPTDPTAIVPPPAGITVDDLDDAHPRRRRPGRLHHPGPPRPARRLADRLGRRKGSTSDTHHA